MDDIFKVIASRMDEMSKSQKKIANYVLSHQMTVPFLNITTLASNAEVSEATIVRFATFLEFSGYPELQHQFQQAMQKHLTTFERLEISQHSYNEDLDEAVLQMFNNDIAYLKSTAESLDLDVFNEVVKLVSGAKKIVVIANRSSSGLGQILEYYLDMILGNTFLVHNLNDSITKLDLLTPEDAAIAISFPRYSSNTVDVLRFVHGKNIKTVALTDALLSPLVPYANYPLFCETRMPTFFDSYVAPLSLINALVMEVSKSSPNIENRLKELEQLWTKYDAYAAKSGE